MRRYTKVAAVFVAVVILAIVLWPCTSFAVRKPYGVFVGLDSKNIEKLINYDEVVIDALYYDKKAINYLHNNNVRVYSYLNIGSIEDFRPYYNDFLDIALDDYENWPSEKWLDVSDSKWQDYIVNTVAKDLTAKGIDGFFIDNVDVYSKYKEEKIFLGVKTILEKISTTYKKPVIVNGGYDFFTDAVSKKTNLSKMAYGINLESVYTDYDFENKSFKRNDSSARKDIINFLNNMKSSGLNIYVIEYSKDKLLSWVMYYHYKWLGFKFYISDNIELK